MGHDAGSQLELSAPVAGNQENTSLELNSNPVILAEPEKSRSTLRLAAILIALSVRHSCYQSFNINQLMSFSLTQYRP